MFVLLDSDCEVVVELVADVVASVVELVVDVVADVVASVVELVSDVVESVVELESDVVAFVAVSLLVTLGITTGSRGGVSSIVIRMGRFEN